MKCKEDGNIYSLNQGNSCQYDDRMNHFLSYCMEENPTENRPYSLRYIGSMVADLHRTIIKGGIFIYPADKKNVTGKLRLQYECNPMAFIIEAAGGKAMDGNIRILDIQPSELHQRVPIFIGSSKMVDKAMSFMKEELPI